MINTVKMPAERIAVLVGTRGKTKREIESLTHTKLDIKEDVTITGESLDVLTAECIVKAVARGFAPQKALELLDEGITLIIMDLPKERKKLIRVKSRIIGSHGSFRKNVEILTHTYISVYGKTVSIIGEYRKVGIVKNVIENLMAGDSHKSLYKFIESRLNKK